MKTIFNRRRFMQWLGLGTGAGVAATAISLTPTPTAKATETSVKSGYRETDHIRAYYRSCR